MAFDARDDRASAQGFFLWPLHPTPDGLALSAADRRMVLGIYAGLIEDDPINPDSPVDKRFERRILFESAGYRIRYNFVEPFPY